MDEERDASLERNLTEENPAMEMEEEEGDHGMDTDVRDGWELEERVAEGMDEEEDEEEPTWRVVRPADEEKDEEKVS